MDRGADDYVIKPFDLQELRARVRALVRRGRGQVAGVLVAGAVVPAGADGATPGVAAGSDMAGGTGTDSGGMYSGPVCPQPASATLATIATAGNSLEL